MSYHKKKTPTLTKKTVIEGDKF